MRDLLKERDKRLAILLENDTPGDDEQFVKSVIAVKRVYQRELEKQSINELKQVEIQREKDSKPLVKLINNVKRVFKIGQKPQMDQVEKNPEDEIYKNGAFNTLGYCREKLREIGNPEYDTEIAGLLNEQMSIYNRMTYNKNRIIDPYILDVAIEKYSGLVNNSKDPSSTFWTNEKLSVGSIYNSHGKLKSPSDIKNESFAVMNIMLKRMPHTDSFVNDGKKTYMKCIFENPEDEKLYYSIMNKYKGLEADINELYPYKDCVKNAAEEISEKNIEYTM